MKTVADAQLLEDYRKESGKTKCFLAQKMHISRPYLYKLMRNPEDCTVWQAKQLCEELNIKKKTEHDKIFLP